VIKKTIILVVDNDSMTYKILDLLLDKADFEVLECPTARQAIQACVSIKPDILLLSMCLPDMSSEDIIKAIREWSTIPIIIVSSHSENEDVIRGLGMGADDYVFKPFNADVLRARINACLRKSAILDAGAPEISNGPLRMDLTRHQVFLGEQLIALTPKQYKMLRYFIVNCGKMLGYKAIMLEVWGPAHRDDTQYLRVMIGQLRKKLAKYPDMSQLITTEIGIGYRMEFLQDSEFIRQGELGL
jgi:two-component system, OmpR family, KDP operon response regulator KdpE